MTDNLKDRFKKFIKNKNINIDDKNINKMFDNYAET